MYVLALCGISKEIETYFEEKKHITFNQHLVAGGGAVDGGPEKDFTAPWLMLRS